MKKYFIILILITILFGCTLEDPITHEVIKEGKVKRIEYLQGGYGKYNETIIYFTDDTIIVSRGHIDVPYKNIQIVKPSNILSRRYKVLELDEEFEE